MKWEFEMGVLIVEWSGFRGGLKAGFYCNRPLSRSALERWWLHYQQSYVISANKKHVHFPYWFDIINSDNKLSSILYRLILQDNVHKVC